MMMTRMRPFALLSLMAIAAMGCESDATSPDFQDLDALKADVALMAADAMFQDLAVMQTPTAVGGLADGPEQAGIEIESSRSFKKTVKYFKKDGTEQDRYDRLTTDRMEVKVEVEREVSRTFWSAEIERERRTGYAWYGTWPESLPKARESWREKIRKN